MATPKKDWKKEWEQTAAKARKLAKRANQRMLRLENYAKRPGYSSIIKYAYARAEDYIKNFIGIGKSKKTEIQGKCKT